MDFLVGSVRRRLSESRKKSRSLPLYGQPITAAASVSPQHHSLESRISSSSPKLGWSQHEQDRGQQQQTHSKRRRSSSCLPSSQRSDSEGSPSDTTSCSSLEFLPGSSWKTPESLEQDQNMKAAAINANNRKERLEALKARVTAERNKYRDNSSSSSSTEEIEDEESTESKGYSRYHSDEALNRGRSRSSRTDRFMKRRSQDLEAVSRRHVTRSDPHLPVESRARTSWYESTAYQEPIKFPLDSQSQSASEGTPTPTRKSVLAPVPHQVVAKTTVMSAARKPLTISVHGLGSHFPPASPCDSGLGSHSMASSPSLGRAPTPPPRSPKADLVPKRLPFPESRSPTSTIQSDASPIPWWRKKHSAHLPPQSPTRTEAVGSPLTRVYSYTDQAPTTSAYMSDSQLEPRRKFSEDFSRKLGAWKAMESAAGKGRDKVFEVTRPTVLSLSLTPNKENPQKEVPRLPDVDKKDEEFLTEVCRTQKVVWPKDFSNGVSRSPVLESSPRSSPPVTWIRKEVTRDSPNQQNNGDKSISPKPEICTNPTKEPPKHSPVTTRLWSPPVVRQNPTRISAAEALGVVAAIPLPPTRVASLETARRSVDALVDRERRRRCSEHLEDALNELETIYQSLRLNDDDELLDRAERRDMPQYRSSLGQRPNHWQKRYSIADPTAAMGFPLARSYSENSARLRRSAVPDKVADDLAVRKLQQTPVPPRNKLPTEAASSPSYLLCSPAFTPSLTVEPGTRDVLNLNEPDPELDDVGYRKFSQTSRSLPPHPPFGIPLDPSPKSPPSSYLFTETNGSAKIPDWRSSKKNVQPDVVRDDLAYRNLRRKGLFQPGSRHSVSVLSDLEDWTRPASIKPLPAKGEESMADIIAALERLGQRSPPPVPKRRSAADLRTASGFYSDNQGYSATNQDASPPIKKSPPLNSVSHNESKCVIQLTDSSALGSSSSKANPFPTFTSSFSMMNDASSRKQPIHKNSIPQNVSAKGSSGSKGTAVSSEQPRVSSEAAKSADVPLRFGVSNGLEVPVGASGLDPSPPSRNGAYKEERRQHFNSKFGEKHHTETVDTFSESSNLRRSLRLKDKDGGSNASNSSSSSGIRRFISRDQQSSDTDPQPWMPTIPTTGTDTSGSDLVVRSTKASRLRAQLNVHTKPGDSLAKRSLETITGHSQTKVSNQSSTDHNENFTERRTSLQRAPSYRAAVPTLASTTESDNSSEPGGAKIKDKSAKRKSNLNRSNVLEEVMRPPPNNPSLERRNRRLRHGSDSSHTSGSDKTDLRASKLNETIKQSSTDSQSDSKASTSSVLRRKPATEKDTDFSPDSHSSPRRKVTALKKPEIPQILKRTSSPTHTNTSTPLKEGWSSQVVSSTPLRKTPSFNDATGDEIEDIRCLLSTSFTNSPSCFSDKPSDDSYHSLSQAPDTEVEDSFGTPPETLTRIDLNTESVVYTLSVSTKSTPYNSDPLPDLVEAVNLNPLTSLLEQIHESRSEFSVSSITEPFPRANSLKFSEFENNCVEPIKVPVPILKRKSLEEDRKEDIQGILKFRSKETNEEEQQRRPPSILKKRESSEEKEFESVLLNPIFRKYVLEESGGSVHSILKTKSLEDPAVQPRPILKRGSASEEQASDTNYSRCVEIPRPILKKKAADEDSAPEEKPRPILKSRLSQEDMSESMKPSSDSSESSLLKSILRKSSLDQDRWAGRKDMRRNSDEVLSDSSLNLLRATNFGMRRGSEDLPRPSSLAPYILKRSFEKLETSPSPEDLLLNSDLLNKDNASTSSAVPCSRRGGLRVSDGVVPSVKERFDRRNTPRYRTQPITQVEVQETDNLESVQAFRTLITTKASESVFERPEEEEEEAVAAPTAEEAFKREYPQRYRPDRKKDRRTNSRYRTLPITLETPLEELTNANTAASDSIASSSSDEMSGLTVMAKASLFQQKAIESAATPLARRSSEIRNKIMLRRMHPRSQTQPITEEEVQEAAKFVDNDKKSANENKNEDSTEDEKDPSKLSLAQKMLLFDMKMQEVTNPKITIEKGPRRRRSAGHSRFQTQPVTTEEVRKASRHSLGGLASALRKPEEEEDDKESFVSSSLWKSTVQREAEKRVADVAPVPPPLSSATPQADWSRQDFASSLEEKISTAAMVVKMASSSRAPASSDTTPKTTASAPLTELSKSLPKSTREITTRGLLLAELRKETSSQKSENSVADGASTKSRTIPEKSLPTAKENPTEVKAPPRNRASSDVTVKEKAANGTARARAASELTAKGVPNKNEKSKPSRSEEEASSSSSESDDEEGVCADNQKNVLPLGQSHMVFYSPGQQAAQQRRNITNQGIQRKLNANLRRKEERRLQHSELGKVFQPSLSSPALEVESLSLGREKEGDQTEGHHKHIKRSQTQPMPPKGSDSSPIVEGGSIKDRLAALQRSGTEDWQKRLCQSPESLPGNSPKAKDTPPEEDGSSHHISSRLSQLQKSSEQWRHRVEEKDAAQFTVAGKLAAATIPLPTNGTSPLLERKVKKMPLPFKSPISARKIQHPNAVAVLPMGLSKSKSVPMALGSSPKQESSSEEEEEKGQRVLVPKADDDTFKSFFDLPSFYKNKILNDDTVEISTETFDQVTSQSHHLLVQRHKIQGQKRHHAGSRNPIRKLASRSDFQQQEYMEVSSTGVAQRELRRMQVEQLAKTSDKCLSALAGLASTEDFKNVSLRKGGEGSAALLPSHNLMLVQVKGRRHVQTRLVEPCIFSLNQGDSYVLATPTKVFCWIGAYTNVIERAKVSEVASIVQLKKDLCFRGSSQLVTIDLEKKEDPSAENNTQPNLKQKEWDTFYSLLGDSKVNEEGVLLPGAPEEDELYETAIIDTNMMYVLEGDSLIPSKEYWGSLPKVEVLQSDKVVVFDFGSEMYVWKGKLSSQEERTSGVKLAKELWEKGYDYTECHINPIFPRNITETSGVSDSRNGLHSNSDSTKSAASPPSPSDDRKCEIKSPLRPKWCIFAPINQHMEPVLFREKFLDWPDKSRLIKVKGQEDETDTTTQAIKELEPCDAEEMFNGLYSEPELVLEGQNIGRGLEWYDDKERRAYEITSVEVNVWHILEYESRLLAKSNGQLHSGDTYVVRWRYMVTQKGRNFHGQVSRYSFTGRVRCAYFFWQGVESSITEKGASALMTVELDEERGPHVRVNQGKEPPSFLNLFEGHMIIYKGEREDETTNTPGPWKLFLVRGHLESETYLLEVDPEVKSLRSRACFLLVNCSTGCIFVWHGLNTREAEKVLARQCAHKLLESPPEEMLLQKDSKLDIIEVLQGAEPKTFRHAFSTDSSQWFSLTPQTNGPEECASPRLFHLTSGSGIFMANEIFCTYRSSINPCLLPFLQEDIYSVSQPALFLLEPSSRDCLYLWQGWWPEGDLETGSAIIRWAADRRCAMQTALDYAKVRTPEEPLKVHLVIGGLEPKHFTSLFPEWHSLDYATQANLQDGKLQMGQCLNVHEELAKLTRTQYSLEELQALPPPEGVDPKNLEKYLDSKDFQEIMQMSREEFYNLPKWKQDKIKKEVQLF